MKARRATVKSWASLKAWLLLCLVMLCVAGVKAQTPYAIWCEGNSTLYFTNSNVTFAVGGTYDGNTITNVWSGDDVTNYGDQPQWNIFEVGINCTKVVFDQSFREVKLTSLKRWFARLYNPALQFVGLENLNTSEVTDMSYMFEINRLKNIDLSSLNTGKVTTMKGMFQTSLDLTSIDLSGFNTENVTDMSQMFRDCNALTSLNLSSFNTQKVTDMAQMFLGCGALTDLDLSSFNTENVTSMYYMFARCLKLPSLDLSHFDTGKVTNMTCMFGNCKTLSYLELSNFKTDNVQKMEQMFIDCENLKTIFRDNDWNTENVTNADKMFSGCTSLVGGNGTAYDAEHIDKEYARIDRAGTPGYFTKNKEAYAIWCKNNATFYFVNSAISYMENGVYDGQTITKVWSGEQVTETAGWMEDFSHNEDMNLHIECQKIVFDESFKDVKPSNLSQWFYYFEKVTSIEGIEYLNTSEATKMDWMFKACSELTTIDVSNFDTSKVTDMRSMFNGCNDLTNILGLEKLKTSNVTNMNEMFQTCYGLTTVDLSNFDTRNVTDMSFMFRNCSNLTNISGLENLNTSNVTNMRNMFYGCSALTVLDLSSFDVSKVVYINQIFDGCKSLKRIYSKNDWNTQYSGTTSTAYMFNDCTSLIGGNGTAFDSDHIDKEYARIDRAGTPGYFTNKNKEAYAIWCEGNSTLYFTYTTLGDTFDGQTITKVWSGEQVTETVGWMEDYARHEDMNLHDECQKIVIDESFKDVKPSNMSEWFCGFEKVTSIEGIEYLNTSEATKIDQMFYDCSELTTIDVSNFDTNNVTDMRKMFKDCNGLTNISGLENLNTSKVTDMSDMFNGCSNLTTIDLRNFDTGNVKNMSGMFRDCGSLTSISGLENLNTSNVTNMSFMFYGCSSLTVLDLSSFDVSKVEYLTQMFEGCTSLETIYSKNDWNTQYPGTASTAFMFNNCTSLIGGNGTEYSLAYTNGIYANLDVNGKRGYFTSTFEYTIGSAMVGTLYLDFAVTLPANQDYFHAYTVKSISETGTIHLKEVSDVIPANTAVIIFGNEGTYKMMQNAKEMPAINDNLLCGVAEETSVSDLKTKHGTDIYVLSLGKDSYINFRKAGGSVKTIPANRAYLPYSTASGAKELSFVFDVEDGEATGIGNVATEKAERTGVFNLSGQRVAKPQHGIYIVNGKKVFIP